MSPPQPPSSSSSSSTSLPPIHLPFHLSSSSVTHNPLHWHPETPLPLSYASSPHHQNHLPLETISHTLLLPPPPSPLPTTPPHVPKPPPLPLPETPTYLTTRNPLHSLPPPLLPLKLPLLSCHDLSYPKKISPPPSKPPLPPLKPPPLPATPFQYLLHCLSTSLKARRCASGEGNFEGVKEVVLRAREDFGGRVVGEMEGRGFWGMGGKRRKGISGGGWEDRGFRG